MASIAALNTETKKVYVGGAEYTIAPFTVGVQAKIAEFFINKGKPDGLSYALTVLSSGIVTPEFIEVITEMFYCLIEAPSESLEDFKKRVQKKEKAIGNLVTLILNQIDSSKEDYQFEVTDTPAGKKKVMLGWIILIFSIIGLIATMYWLADMVTHLPNFANLLRVKFSTLF